MNIMLGLRALVLLAFVAASTAVIIEPAWIGAADKVHLRSLGLVVAVSHH